MLRYSLVLLLLLDASATACAGDSTPVAQLRLEGLRAPQPERYLVGEPIELTATLENLTGEAIKVTIGPQVKIQVAGPLRADCVEQQLISMGYVTSDSYTLGPHERGKVVVDAASRGAVEPGEYEAWAVYDAGNAPEDHLVDEGIARLQLQSDVLRFEVVAPSGIDAQALEQLGGPCHRMPLLGDGAVRLLESFPSSSYAGWAMGSSPSPWDRVDLPSPKDPVDRMLWIHWNRARPTSLPDDPAAAAKVLEAFAESAKSAKKQLERRASYLEARPDFVDADRMRLSMAYLHIEAGDNAAARQLLEELVAKRAAPRWVHEQATLAISFLKEREASRSEVR